MVPAGLLALVALQAAPAHAAPSTLPTLAREVRSAELVAYARVLRVQPHALEGVDGKPVRVRHGDKEARLAELEILSAIKGDPATKKLWLLAQPDNAAYDFALADAGAQALCFLTRGEDPSPEGCTYLAGTQEVAWRCGLGSSGFVPFEEQAGARTLLAPGWRFEASDGTLAALPVGADGRVARVDAKLLEARIRALADEQRAVWLTASASGGFEGFGWELVLRQDRTATLTIERAAGPEPHETWVSNPIMNDIADRIVADAPAEKQVELGLAKEHGLVRGLQVRGGVELKLLTLEREWLADPAHKRVARWGLQLYSSVRSGIKEPGLLDGRQEDRDALRF